MSGTCTTFEVPNLGKPDLSSVETSTPRELEPVKTIKPSVSLASSNAGVAHNVLQHFRFFN